MVGEVALFDHEISAVWERSASEALAQCSLVLQRGPNFIPILPSAGRKQRGRFRGRSRREEVRDRTRRGEKSSWRAENFHTARSQTRKDPFGFSRLDLLEKGRDQGEKGSSPPQRGEQEAGGVGSHFSEIQRMGIEYNSVLAVKPWRRKKKTPPPFLLFCFFYRVRLPVGALLPLNTHLYISVESYRVLRRPRSRLPLSRIIVSDAFPVIIDPSFLFLLQLSCRYGSHLLSESR